MSKLDLSNVIRVTLLTALRGLANLNTSALAIITDEVPIPADFGTSRTYLNADGVGEDFGTTSDTYLYAVAIFSQVPNIITGGGYLVVIPRLAAAAASAAVLSPTGPVNLLSLTATDYNINANVDGAGASDELIGTIDTTSLATAQTSLNSTAVTAAGLVFSLSGTLSSCFVTLSTIATGATKSLVLGDAATGTDIASLLNLPKTLTVNGQDAGAETVKDAILRTKGAVEYFGIVLNEQLSDADLTETAALVQTLDKLMFVGSEATSDLTGIFTTLLNKGYTHTRTILYTYDGTAATALKFVAGYAGRALSTNFDGVNTAQTMHLKEIVGFVADTLTQSNLDAAALSGTDVYADFGVPKVFTSGANKYFDQIYSELAFKIRIQIAGFNFLAQTNTKIPQTEEGMNGLKGAFRAVCSLFVTNGTFAPGTWNDATKFGNPEDHVRNIKDFGYFIYSLPIAQQAQAVREQRVAPAVQIAGKSAGAIHSADVTVFIEA
jgi:hypothetical protein